MATDLELFPNKHKGDLCVIIDDSEWLKLERAEMKPGTSCSISMYATAPVGTRLWLCVHNYGWGGGRPTNDPKYARAKVTHSQVLPPIPRDARDDRRYKTTFVLV